MFIVGLTGGIGSGKSTVASAFHSLGAGLVDADIIARDVVAPGTLGLARIQDQFGDGILNDDGTLNRSKLRTEVFEDEGKRQWLNDLLHPLIREQMIHQCRQQTTPYTVLVIPLLVENRLQSLANRILVVDVAESIQLQRTMSRDNVSAQEAQAIMRRQASRWQRLHAADDIISNENIWAKTEKSVLQLHQHYLEFAKQTS
ncbi:dephospho-CoA kinase [Echinimonas agarilytica]|uniref:Dephospho-CoA kinase n=1 Tax=Echinimonas agarilytica TaxID=1215918 RepID=A0AA41W4I9_9GAMM|nr:dephospho-CoA kinase [Echinimonas agarilytica]